MRSLHHGAIAMGSAPEPVPAKRDDASLPDAGRPAGMISAMPPSRS